MDAQMLDNVRTVVLASHVLRGTDTTDVAAHRKLRSSVFPYITNHGGGRFTVEGYEHPVTGEVLDRAYDVLTAAEATERETHGTWTTIVGSKLFSQPMRFCIVEVA